MKPDKYEALYNKKSSGNYIFRCDFLKKDIKK